MAEFSLRQSKLANRDWLRRASEAQVMATLGNARGTMFRNVILGPIAWAAAASSAGMCRAELARRKRVEYLQAAPVLMRLARVALDAEAVRWHRPPGSGGAWLLAWMRGAVAALELAGHAEAGPAGECVRLVLAKTLVPDMVLSSWAEGDLPSRGALGWLRSEAKAAAREALEVGPRLPSA